MAARTSGCAACAPPCVAHPPTRAFQASASPTGAAAANTEEFLPDAMVAQTCVFGMSSSVQDSSLGGTFRSSSCGTPATPARKCCRQPARCGTLRQLLLSLAA